MVETKIGLCPFYFKHLKVEIGVMDLFCITERFMQKNSLMNGIMGISLALLSTATFAVTPEGYWKSIDDRTGEQL